MTRRWFREETAPELTTADRVQLNRAVRCLVDVHKVTPNRAHLAMVRGMYNPGMAVETLVAMVLERVRVTAK